MKRVFRRPSPAMVIAIVALIAALGGTAIAGGFTTKKKVNKIITNRAPGLTVGSAKSADSAKAADKANNVLWAVVSDAGTASLVRASISGVTVDDVTGVDVNFGRDVSQCSWIASRSQPGTGIATNGWAQTALSSTTANAVNVRTRDNAGVIDEDSFHLQVIC